MPHYLGGKILAGNYIIRDSSVFTYIESTFRNMWAVLASTTFCISCSDGLPGIWSIKFLVPFFIMPRAPITSAIVLVLSFQIFDTSISKSLYLESFWKACYYYYYKLLKKLKVTFFPPDLRPLKILFLLQTLIGSY